MIAEIVDEILVAGEVDVVDRSFGNIVKKFKFENVVHGPGKIQFFGFSITQNEDFSCVGDGNDKI